MLDKTKHTGGPLLRDGKTVGELLDSVKRNVDLRVNSDAEIFELELEHIWAKAWVVVGHASEIPNTGDFVTRDVGADRIILMRNGKNEIKAFLNVCPHKGMQICRTDAGSTDTLRCIYHGWSFSIDGEFRGAPFKQKTYGDALIATDQVLRQARVGVVGGLVFVCWDQEAPSLDQFLGDMKYYLEQIFDRNPNGTEVLGPPQRWIIDGNWKTLAEQFGGDNYHSVTLHRSLAEMGLVPGEASDPDMWGLNNLKISTAEGHSLITHDLRAMYKAIAAATGGDMTTQEKLRHHPPAGITPDTVDRLGEKFSEKELEILAQMPPSVGGLFPNVAIIAFMVPLPDGSLASTYGIHTFIPKAPNKTEYIHWNFIPRGASTEYRELALQSSTLNVSCSGFVEQDDNEIYAELQRSANGFIGRQSKMQYLALAGDSEVEGWVGGGSLHTGFTRDDGQWKWWCRYFEYMTGAIAGETK